jgi:hypothetical protein
MIALSVYDERFIVSTYSTNNNNLLVICYI